MDIKIYELLVIKQEQTLDIPSCLCTVLLHCRHTNTHKHTHNTLTHKAASLSMGHRCIPEKKISKGLIEDI